MDDPGRAEAAATEPAARRRRPRVPFGLIIGLVVVGGAGLAIVLGSQPRGLPLISDGSAVGRIATIDPAGVLVTIAPDATAARRFELPGGAFSFPAYSPDASRIAAIGTGADAAGVYVLNDESEPSPGTVPVPSFRGPTIAPFYLYWAPDGSRIAALGSEAGGSLVLQALTADGSAEPEIVQRGSPLYWDWVGESRLLLHVGGSAQDAYLGEVMLGDESPEPTVPGPGRFSAPVVSFDERYRAYALLGDDPGGDVVIEERSTDGARRIAVPGPTALGWSPTADTIAFIGGSAEYGFPFGPLHVADATSGVSRVIVNRDVIAFYWAPDGRSIAALVVPPAAERQAAGGGAIVRLVFVDPSTGVARGERLVRPSLTFINEVLPFFDQYALSHRLWSPRSDGLVLPLIERVGDASGIFVVPADGAEPRRIADGEIAFWSP